MSETTLLLDEHAGAVRAVPLLEAGPSHTRQHGALAALHRLLRGRYALAITLGTLGAVGGGVAGYVTQHAEYRGDGQVRVKTYIAPILHATPETVGWGDPNREVNTQAALIASERVLQAAMNSDDWRALGRPSDAKAKKEFRESLKVTASREAAELILVSFTDRDAKASRVGVEVVLDAYKGIYVEGAATTDEETKIRVIQEEIRGLNSEVAKTQQEIQSLSREYGTDDLAKWQELYQARELELKDSLFALRHQLSTVEGMPAPGAAKDAGQPNPADQPKPMTYEEIASVDPTMKAYVHDHDALEHDLVQMRQDGFRDTHRAVVKKRNELTALEDTMKAYAARFMEGRVVPNAEAAPNPRTMNPEQLRTLIARTEQDLRTAHEESVSVGTAKSKLDELRDRRKGKLAEIQFREVRLEDLNREGLRGESSEQRIRIFKPVETPSLPANDRRIRMSILGVLGGGGLPIALVALWGLVDQRRRLTFSDQTCERPGAAPLLGILPQLPRDLADPEQSAAAAHCVHQMRTLLQIGGEERKVYAITSSTAGDGKTSLALSLGMSFAASGARTLLIDFDMIGHGLSSALKVRPEHGLTAALTEGALNGSIVSTGIERLSLLAAGSDDERFVSRLSRAMVHDLVERARAQFDVVLIDTGPILGSLEANYVSAEADGVVLVVGRGQARSYVDRAFEQLRALGARVAGTVFNKASSTDFLQSATSTSFRSVRDDAPPAQARPAGDVPDLVPVARTVALDIRR